MKSIALKRLIFGVLALPLLISFCYALSTKKCIEIDNQKYTVEYAITSKQQEKGLSGRRNLKDDMGMLFPMKKEEAVSVWMKGCKIPIDILFFHRNALVSYIDNVPPCIPTTKNIECPIYRTPMIVDTIVELKAGSRKKYGYNEYTKWSICK